MINSPTIREIQSWLKDKNPLNFFSSEYIVSDIDPKPWSGHFNFLISTSDKKYVLRFKGPEWGESETGIADEYEMLKAIEDYHVAPRAYFVAKDFFGEPVMLQEYIEGTMFSDMNVSEQKNLFSGVARFIAKINSIKLEPNLLAKQEQLISYERHKKIWRARFKVILECEVTKEWGEQIIEILPQAEAMLGIFEERLVSVLKESGSVFIFKSAHAGHLIKMDDGFRFFNWEKNGYGDPSFSLAVFLASIRGHVDFETIKKEMINSYLQEKYVPHFEELVEQRLSEREVSNLLWVLWNDARKNAVLSLKDKASLDGRFLRVKNILKMK